jgi:hypothetical protein
MPRIEEISNADMRGIDQGHQQASLLAHSYRMHQSPPARLARYFLQQYRMILV